MLRITVEDKGNPIVLKAEGKLRGPWVDELEKCWRSTTGRSSDRRIQLDLAGVTFVDADGKALLSEMVEEDVRLVASGPMMNSLIDQIVSALQSKKRLVANPETHAHH